MQSNRFEPGDGHPDRGSRQWNPHTDRRRWPDPHRDGQSGPQHRNGVDGSPQWAGRDSPGRLGSKDCVTPEGGRRGHSRRRLPSPDQGLSDKKRPRGAEVEEDYGYRCLLGDPASRLSADASSHTHTHTHTHRDVKHLRPQEEDFRYQEAVEDSRQRCRRQGAALRRHEGVAPRRSSGYHADRDAGRRRREGSPGRTPSHDHVTTASDADQRGSTRGFQRFLEVLNKGVNMSVLNKIMTQSPPPALDPPPSPAPVLDSAEYLLSPSCPGGQQWMKSHWNAGEGSPRRVSPQRRSFSPTPAPRPDGKPLQRADGAPASCSSSSSGGGTPSTLTSGDEHKHLQGVLQAIGLKLGSEELGQMSHRIQERLYGKRDDDGLPPEPPDGPAPSRRGLSPAAVCSSNPAPSRAQRDAAAGAQGGDPMPSSCLQESQPPPVMPMYLPLGCPPLGYPAQPLSAPPGGPVLSWPPLPPLLHHPGVPPVNIFPAGVVQTRQPLPQINGHTQPLFTPPGQKPKTLSRPRCLQVIQTNPTA
ncbi:transcription factor Zelda-like [Antennarius striatus]|uniref:transcription factor Zelda-like n=1 Tax=Antennarius striatus TaxID=241820 RepID=UPI0035AF4BD1